MNDDSNFYATSERRMKPIAARLHVEPSRRRLVGAVHDEALHCSAAYLWPYCGGFWILEMLSLLGTHEFQRNETELIRLPRTILVEFVERMTLRQLDEYGRDSFLIRDKRSLAICLRPRLFQHCA